ncbi:MAG: response regulator [Candidatus Margulisiibacteriota bacterium]
MFNFIKSQAKIKKNKLLYIDFEEKYQFIIGEIFKSEAEVIYASSFADVKQLYAGNSDPIATIFLCVDQIEHSKIINEIFKQTGDIPSLILISNTLDSIQMYDLVAMYGAKDYLTKPYSKNSVLKIYQQLLDEGKSVFNQRLINDTRLFNRAISTYNTDHNLGLPLLNLEPLDHQIDKLSKIQQKLKEVQDVPKSKRPDILFIDDEKNIIDVYQQFVSDKPFNPFFSGSLKESRQVLQDKKIDLIILDLGLPDGHGINLLKEIYAQNPLDTNVPDVIVISSYYEKTTVIDVIGAGAKVFINKPMTYKKFISVIYQLTFLRYMRKELIQ